MFIKVDYRETIYRHRKGDRIRFYLTSSEADGQLMVRHQYRQADLHTRHQDMDLSLCLISELHFKYATELHSTKVDKFLVLEFTFRYEISLIFISCQFPRLPLGYGQSTTFRTFKRVTCSMLIL